MANVTIGGLSKTATEINNTDNLIMYNAVNGTQKITGETLLNFIQNNLFHNLESQDSISMDEDLCLIYTQDIDGDITYKKVNFSTILQSINIDDFIRNYVEENNATIPVTIDPESYLGAGVEIAEGDNLDNYLTVGRYYNHGTVINNGPFEDIQVFNMVVEQLMDEYIRQTVRPAGEYSYSIRDIQVIQPEEGAGSYNVSEDTVPDEEKQYFTREEVVTLKNIVFDANDDYIINNNINNNYNASAEYYIMQNNNSPGYFNVSSLPNNMIEQINAGRGTSSILPSFEISQSSFFCCYEIEMGEQDKLYYTIYNNLNHELFVYYDTENYEYILTTEQREDLSFRIHVTESYSSSDSRLITTIQSAVLEEEPLVSFTSYIGDTENIVPINSSQDISSQYESEKNVLFVNTTPDEYEYSPVSFEDIDAENFQDNYYEFIPAPAQVIAGNWITMPVIVQENENIEQAVDENLTPEEEEGDSNDVQPEVTG